MLPGKTTFEANIVRLEGFYKVPTVDYYDMFHLHVDDVNIEERIYCGFRSEERRVGKEC